MSEYFEWDPSRFALHVPAMDDEHRQIIGCMNRLHELSASNATRAELDKALKALLDITVRHFKDEESYMEKIGFPDLAKHRIVHKHLLERLAQFKTQFESIGAFTEEFFYFLKMWLKSHICGIDSQYARHANAA